jgi:hypothetical protein
MGMETIQSNLTGGELAPTLHARVDIDKYNTSVAEAENVVIVPQGGLRRRPGLSKITDTKLSGKARLEPFVFNKTQQYLLVFREGFIDVIRAGVVVKANLVSPYLTNVVVEAFDIIQSADTVIITHPDIAPQKLIRGATDADWTISAITLAMPQENFTGISENYVNYGTTRVVDLSINDIVWNNDGNAVNGLDNRFYKSKLNRLAVDLSTDDYTNITNWEDLLVGKEPVWSVTRGYPVACTFHMGRLWFAGSPSKPTSVWGSRVNGFFDFTWVETLGVIPDDHGIFDTIESNQYNQILNIFSGRALQVFTSGAEYVNTTEIITPNASSWAKQTNYGSKRIRPISIDGATLFIDSSGRTIRQFIFDFNEDAYVSNNITLLASHLMTDIIDIGAIKGTSLDVSDYVYIVNTDGTVAVMNTLRSEGVLGWTHWTTAGTFVNVCVVDKAVYFLVLRENNYFIEVLEEDTYTDHNVIIKGTKPTTYNVAYSINNVVYGLNNVVYTDFSTGVAATQIDTDFDAIFDNTYFKVIADFSMQDDAMPTVVSPGVNYFTTVRDAYRIEVGLDFATKVVTLPLNAALKTGPTLHKRKRVVKVDINVEQSLGVFANNIYASDRQFTVVLDEAPTPFTGFKEMYLLGYGRIVQIEISQKNPLPMLIRAIGYEVEY